MRNARATAQTLFKNGRPVRVIHVPQVDAFDMGALMMHFMLETIIMGKLMGVDPFNQPGVEEGKVLARQYLGGGMAMAIRRLSEGTVNRIAAGEVVERPAAAVKELVENALDAGATRIEIAVSNGGADLILVEDDGSGMDAADLTLAIERHATSKLPERNGEDDLSHIETLGFRGEALPSIGAVARLAIASRTARARRAEIKVDGGKFSGPAPAGFRAPGQHGTRVEVRELFYATPARLKFLKSHRSEDLATTDIVKRLAMARPDVAFTLHSGRAAGAESGSRWRSV